MWDALSSLPPLRRGAKLDLLWVGVHQLAAPLTRLQLGHCLLCGLMHRVGDVQACSPWAAPGCHEKPACVERRIIRSGNPVTPKAGAHARVWQADDKLGQAGVRA
jgi:hypothetical protein